MNQKDDRGSAMRGEGDLGERDFAVYDGEDPDRVSRRQFVAMMGASLALAGLSGCSVKPAPSGTIVPYVHAPEEIVPGRPLFYATAMARGDGAVGLLVESHMGRPTKIEGNPLHPASLGATDIFNQAAVLTLYDPDRSKVVLELGQNRTWAEAGTALRLAMNNERSRLGAGLRILTETVVSPTLGGQLNDLLKAYPQAKWCQYEPLHADNAYRASQMAFGADVHTRYDFSKADVVLSLDADFLSGTYNLRYAAEFMARRRVRTDIQGARRAEMNRLYVVETAVTCTGAKADHRLAVRGSEVESLSQAAAAAMGISAGGAAGEHQKWIAAVVKDLQAHRGRSVVLAGERQPAVVHLLAHAMNDRLGNVGQTVVYTDPVDARPVDHLQSLRELVDEMRQGRIEFLVVLGGNPVYTAPADIDFKGEMQKVPLRVHLGLFENETSDQCHWHLPEAHFLEGWSDARAFDGTASIVQPLIEPLYQGRSVHEVVSLLADSTERPGYEIVRGYWRKHWEGKDRAADFEESWRGAVHDGVVPKTAFPVKSVRLRDGWEEHLKASGIAVSKIAAEEEGMELAIDADPTIYDGRFANNGWLQELPKPISKIAWDNAAIMGPKTAARFGIKPVAYAHGGERGGYYVPVVTLHVGEHSVRAPAWVVPGHAEGAITVYLGYGREAAGRVGGSQWQTLGFSAYRFRTSDRPWFATGLRMKKTGDDYPLCCTQGEYGMQEREVVRAGSLEEYQKNPRFAGRQEKEDHREETQRAAESTTLYWPFDYSPPRHKWGMLIDLTTCVGCNACVAACQAENNIPVVGKNQVLAGRVMHWIRVDRYIEDPADRPRGFHFQPLPCMHCEQAPCEYVCPTAATVHSAEGLNDMVYNRCVGTRFCSNNCPYKVRRFNFFHYADYKTPSRRLQYNPDVTVRSRGVMEKCTYCVQRIRFAEHDAQAENRAIVDGEVIPACAAACPTQAIAFGDLNDLQSTVKRWKESPLHYALLAELNTEPRTTYLAALRNLNPELEGG
jgi:molybdopterin-containing oxidoreductase family iron-sulfur binding subunit